MVKESLKDRISEIADNINLEIDRIEALSELIQEVISGNSKLDHVYITLSVVGNIATDIRNKNNQLFTITGD